MRDQEFRKALGDTYKTEMRQHQAKDEATRRLETSYGLNKDMIED